MLSQTTEYALRSVVWLATHYPEPQTSQQIADGMQVPVSYLSKVMQTLGRFGVVTAQRGKRGGFVLSKPPAEMALLQVVSAVEPIRRIHVCPLGLEIHERELCPLHRRLDAALAHVESAFANTTLAEVVDQPLATQRLVQVVEMMKT